MTRSLHSPAYRYLVQRLVEARQASGLTQGQIATAIDRPQSYVAKVEGGERRLDIVELLELAEVLGIDPVALISELSEVRRGASGIP